MLHGLKFELKAEKKKKLSIWFYTSKEKEKNTFFSLATVSFF